MPRPALDPKAALRGTADSTVGPVAWALLATLLLAGAKLVVHWQGWELAVVGLPILAGLLGAIVFTLAIVLNGVLADYKEAERALGEVVSQVRRLHWDFAFSGADAPTLAQLRGHLRTFVAVVLANARHGSRWKLRDLHTPIDAMDRLLVDRIGGHPLPTTRTAQLGLSNLTRNVDRLEVIVETTFMRAGYVFAATAIGLVLTCFLFTGLGSGPAGALTVGAVGFVLVGLYALVRDLDNPMAGSVRISLGQVEKLARFLEERESVEAAAKAAPAASAA